MPDARVIVPINTPGVFDPSGGKNPTFQGGSVLTSVQVQPVFWGAAWAGAQAALIPELEQFFKFVVTSSLVAMLKEYSVPGQTIQLGSVLTAVTVAGSEPGGSAKTIDDSTIQAQVDNWVKDGTLAGGANALYFIFLPPGVTSTAGGQASCTIYCGYHQATPAGNAYAVMPFVQCTGCSQATQLQTFTAVASHELCEAITDPHPSSGWVDRASSGNEIGDFCVGDFATLGGYTVQRVWSNEQNTCALAPPAHRQWEGAFEGAGKPEVLFWVADGNLWLGTFTGDKIALETVANTAGFGDLADGAHPAWVGDFTGSGKTELLINYVGDGNWWLGTFTGNQLTFANVANTKGFGNIADGAHPAWVGDFTGSGKTELLINYVGDGNWWLGTCTGNQLTFALAGTTDPAVVGLLR
jgi:hypothetical protein